MSKPFPMGWLFLGLLAIYTALTGNREPLLYAFILGAFIYAIGAINIAMGKAAMKKVG